MRGNLQSPRSFGPDSCGRSRCHHPGPARLLAILIASLFWAGPTAANVASAAQATVRFAVELPEGYSAGTLLWGITIGPVELAAGRENVADLADAASNGVSRFTGAVEDGIPRDAGPVTVSICLNQDDLEFYIPSVGDLYQTVLLQNIDRRWVARAPRTEWKQRVAVSPTSVITVHYHRREGDYANASLWTWDEHRKRAPSLNELMPVGRDKFGVVFQVDSDLYGEPGDRIGLLPRLNADWNFKDNGDRYWAPAMGSTVYLVQESSQVFTEVPDVSPKVKSVTIDADRHLTVVFTNRLPIADWRPGRFHLTVENGEARAIKAVYPFRDTAERSAAYSIETEEPLDFVKHAYELEVEGFGKFPARVGYILRGSTRFYDPDAVLGATYTPQRTTFRVFAPSSRGAKVVVADAVTGHSGLAEHNLTGNEKGVWSATVEGDLAGKFYAYKLSGIGFHPDEEITDIYATCTQARHERSLIVDLARTDPPGFRDHPWTAPRTPVDAVVYEMHVRDFTIAPNSGAKHRGQYLGVAEAGTRLPDDPSVKTGLDHLTELGVTHVQLMPVQDFFNNEDGHDDYNWGYMPLNFFSPEGWLASTSVGSAKITELKTAIKALHDRGIGVIMDVVYNHTAGEAAFDKLVPGYYFRMNDSGGLSNGSGCGNEFCSENPMARKFILDSVKFWVKEYQVDGFRFDLMGLIDLETLKQMRAEMDRIRPGILLYGEPWAAGPTPLNPITDHLQVRDTGIGAFNDHFRDAIKGDRDGGQPGFIQCGDRADGVVQGLKGAVHDWSINPTDAISYFEAHDNLTAWDKLLQSAPQATDADRRRMMRLAALTLFTSQGMTFLQAGQDFCRTKGGSHNSYNLPDEINQIDWSRKKANADVFAYHRGLIALRRAHPAFRLATRKQVKDRVLFETPPNDRCIVYTLDGSAWEEEPAERILVLLNGTIGPAEFTLPPGSWGIFADADRAAPEPIGQAADKVTVPPNSGLLLMR